jgi:hypothetical protein
MIYAAGDCHPRIDSNPAITLTTPIGGIAVRCGTQNNVDSRCIISHNPNIGVNVTATSGIATFVNGTGVQCDATACSRIDQNHINGVAQSGFSSSCSLNVSGWGLLMTNSAALVAGNFILGNNGSSLNSDGLGISSGGAARIENNYIYGSAIAAGYNQCQGAKSIIGLSVGGSADVDSNYIDSGFTGCWAVSSIPSPSGRYAFGVEVASAGVTLRNNVLQGCASVFEGSTSADPLIFQNTDLPNGYLNEQAVYPNVNGTDPRLTATQVNALTDMTTGGNINASCFGSGLGVKHLAAGAACIDAGTTTGAPTRDYDGQARDAAPDIGPDEYVP